ncbi:hypothetical protein E1B28_009531 [Marasmius oreades]|uniref:Uncharacterized protein n=1 Tax=Marasmius oreades TaxID=181124 RepID=A0A9P7RWE3_9AGAR|nr:uncharacterized protein E1B28_009531 [Marasmius oreades]KAG7090411.1 hypothetical protein E1B28_009531 [Marasmius oreades]
MAVQSGGVFQAASRGDNYPDSDFQDNLKRPATPATPPFCATCFESLVGSIESGAGIPGAAGSVIPGTVESGTVIDSGMSGIPGQGTRSHKGPTTSQSSPSQSSPTTPPRTTDTLSVQTQTGTDVRTASNDGSTTSSTAGISTQVTAQPSSSIGSSSSPFQGPSVVSTTVTESSITTQVVNQTSSATSNHKRNKVPIILGSVIGAVALLSLSIGALLYCRRYSRRARRRSSRSEDLSPFTVAPSAQAHSANKLDAERERTQTVDVDDDHHERDRDELENGGQDIGRESVISSSDMLRMSTSNPPPSYRS